MQENESILTSMNPLYLLAGLILVCGIGWYCARRYRNTNDFKKSTRLYLPLMLAADAVLLFGLDIDILLCAGLDLCGFIAMALRSNYYFYH